MRGTAHAPARERLGTTCDPPRPTCNIRRPWCTRPGTKSFGLWEVANSIKRYAPFDNSTPQSTEAPPAKSNHLFPGNKKKTKGITLSAWDLKNRKYNFIVCSKCIYLVQRKARMSWQDALRMITLAPVREKEFAVVTWLLPMEFPLVYRRMSFWTT